MPNGRNVQEEAQAIYFYQLARQIWKIKETYERFGVQISLIDTP